MRRRWVLTILAVLLIASIAGSFAHAGEWGFDWDIGSLRATGWVSGMGADNALTTLNGYGTVYAKCRSWSGQVVLGTKPLPFDTLETHLFLTDLLTGIANIQIDAPDPTLLDVNTLVTPYTAGCPSSWWTVIGLDADRVNWTGAHMLVVGSLSGGLLYDLSFTCDTIHDANGIAVDVNCSYIP